MTHGTVPAARPRRHHADWLPQPASPWRPQRAASTTAIVTVILGLAGTALVIRDVL
jgi:hypothetical protein